jgi:hypothetical protein
MKSCQTLVWLGAQFVEQTGSCSGGDVEVDSKRDHPPEEHGKNGREKAVDRVDVREVVVIPGNDEPRDQVGQSENGRNLEAKTHGADFPGSRIAKLDLKTVEASLEHRFTRSQTLLVSYFYLSERPRKASNSGR